MTERPSATVALLLLAGGIVACSGNEAAPEDEGPLPVELSLRGRQPDPTGLTWAVNGSRGPVDESELRAAVERAAAVWSATPHVGFRPANDGEIANVTFSWERGAHEGCRPFGIDGSIAHTGPMGPAMFVHLDAGRVWGADGESLFVATLHELGHVLGLGHTRSTDSVMQANARIETLGRTDLLALETLYATTTEASGSLEVREVELPRTVAVLAGIAPADRTKMRSFHTDDAGGPELLVWRTDREGRGELLVVHFEDGRPLRTEGPYLGAVPPGSDVILWKADWGERYFIARGPVVEGEEQELRIRRFDERGLVRIAPEDEPRIRNRFLGSAVGQPTPLVLWEGDDEMFRIERVPER